MRMWFRRSILRLLVLTAAATMCVGCASTLDLLSSTDLEQQREGLTRLAEEDDSAMRAAAVPLLVNIAGSGDERMGREALVTLISMKIPGGLSGLSTAVQESVTCEKAVQGVLKHSKALDYKYLPPSLDALAGQSCLDVDAWLWGHLVEPSVVLSKDTSLYRWLEAEVAEDKGSKLVKTLVGSQHPSQKVAIALELLGADSLSLETRSELLQLLNNTGLSPAVVLECTRIASRGEGCFQSDDLFRAVSSSNLSLEAANVILGRMKDECSSSDYTLIVRGIVSRKDVPAQVRIEALRYLNVGGLSDEVFLAELAMSSDSAPRLKARLLEVLEKAQQEGPSFDDWCAALAEQLDQGQIPSAEDTVLAYRWFLLHGSGINYTIAWDTLRGLRPFQELSEGLVTMLPSLPSFLARNPYDNRTKESVERSAMETKQTVGDYLYRAGLKELALPMLEGVLQYSWKKSWRPLVAAQRLAADGHRASVKLLLGDAPNPKGWGIQCLDGTIYSLLLASEGMSDAEKIQVAQVGERMRKNALRTDRKGRLMPFLPRGNTLMLMGNLLEWGIKARVPIAPSTTAVERTVETFKEDVNDLYIQALRVASWLYRFREGEPGGSDRIRSAILRLLKSSTDYVRESGYGMLGDFGFVRDLPRLRKGLRKDSKFETTITRAMANLQSSEYRGACDFVPDLLAENEAERAKSMAKAAKNLRDKSYKFFGIQALLNYHAGVEFFSANPCAFPGSIQCEVGF